jgi:hypothetical protein
MGNAKANDERQELVEDEVALQRWTWEGGSPWDRFGVMAKIEAQLERLNETTKSSGRRNDSGTNVCPRALA